MQDGKDSGSPPTEKPSPPSRARSVQVNPALVDEHFQQQEVLEQTVKQVGEHARVGSNIAMMAGKLLDVVKKELFVIQPDGSMEVKDGITVADAKRHTTLLISIGEALYKGNMVYRKNRGLHDKQQLEHSGRVDGGRAEDTLAAYLGFPLQGIGRRPVPVSEEISGGQVAAQSDAGESANREDVSDSN